MFTKLKSSLMGVLTKIMLIIVVRGELKNKELDGYTCSLTASIMTLKYVLADAVKHKARVYQLYFYWSILAVRGY